MSSFRESVKRILRLSRKPTWEEYLLTLRICLFGLLLIGIYGFIIQLISLVLQSLPR
ncbi:MAG: protein translocase SEC61 complex subunit gamma [Candidatus Methanomethylicia archaeon]